MIRNIIFDIGNVLTDYRWEGFLADKGFDAEMIQKIAKASVMHPAWAEYDRGTWTDEQVLAAFVKDGAGAVSGIYEYCRNSNSESLCNPLATGIKGKRIPCVLSV